MKKLFSLVFCTLFLISSAVSVFANSAQTYFRGISSTGTMVAGEQSPLLVQKELLTFDIQEFPLEHYREEGEYLSYTGKVTAEYTFHNPADYDVTATLAFPFGRTPDYGYAFHPDTQKQVSAVDAEKYDVTADGVPIEKTVRHTLSYRGEDFALEKDLPRLIDGYLEDDFWNFDLPVTKYAWEISGIDEDVFQAARLGFVWQGNGAERKLMLLEQSGGRNSDEEIAVTRWVENGDLIEVYVFGEPLTEELAWFSENGSEDTPFAYTLTPLPTETATYADFVFSAYTEGAVSRSDWYNAMTMNLKNCEWDRGILGSFTYSGTNIADDLLRWYEYEITVPAGGTLVNTVTAPMYPDLNVRYEPPIYAYTYLLSPAATWADFGNLDIVINTPYYMTESGGAFSFEKTETGYRASLDGLPEGELEFTLSESPSPKAPRNPLGGEAVIIGAAVVLLVVVWRRRKGGSV